MKLKQIQSKFRTNSEQIQNKFKTNYINKFKTNTKQIQNKFKTNSKKFQNNFFFKTNSKLQNCINSRQQTQHWFGLNAETFMARPNHLKYFLSIGNVGVARINSLYQQWLKCPIKLQVPTRFFQWGLKSKSINFSLLCKRTTQILLCVLQITRTYLHKLFSKRYVM